MGAEPGAGGEGGGGRTKLDYFKKRRYTCGPHTAKIHTLFKAFGLKRHPPQDA